MDGGLDFMTEKKFEAEQGSEGTNPRGGDLTLTADVGVENVNESIRLSFSGFDHTRNSVV